MPGKVRGFDGVSRKRPGEQRHSRGDRLVAEDRGGPRGGSLRSGLAQLELQPPAVFTGLGIGPDFDGADFGQLRAELDGHQALAGFPETQQGV